MAKTTRSTYLRVEVVDDNLHLSLGELCRECGVHAEAIIDLIEHGVLQPRGHSPGQWQFAGSDLIRIKKALRIQRDLAVNLAGVALSLDLLDEIERLQRQLQRAGSHPENGGR